MLEVRRLRLLRELAYRGTLTAVAEALSYSVSTVSEQLSQLAVEAGVELLEPVGRGVRLTPAAHLLVDHADRILQQLEEAEAAVERSRSTVTGVVRVASFQTATLALLPPALTHLSAQWPELVVHVTQAEPDDALDGLRIGDHDIVIIEEYPGAPRPHPDWLHAEQLLTDPIRLTTPDRDPWPPSTAGLAALADHAWVMEREGTVARAWSQAVCRSAGFEPRVQFESNDLVLHSRLVRHGHAAALLPDLALPDGHLAAASPPVGHRRILAAVRHGAVGRPAIRAASEALQAAASHRQIPSGS